MIESSGIDWERATNRANEPRRRTYRQTVCPDCGRTISESAYSGISGNFQKHARTHLKEGETMVTSATHSFLSGRGITSTAGRCRRCEKKDRKRHVYQWKRSSTRLLRDAICPTCKAPLHGTSRELREPIVYHGEPQFADDRGITQ